MNSYVIIKIVLTVIIAVILGVTVNSYLQTYNTDEVVIVASREIEEAEIITEAMLREENVRLKEKDQLAPSSSDSKEDFIGKIARNRIPVGRPLNTVFDVIDDSGSVTLDSRGQPIVRRDVSESYALGDDQRILTLDLLPTATFQGRIVKDDLVDILGTYEDDDVIETLVLAQGIRVHRVQQVDDGDMGGNRLVSFIVTPDEGKRITLFSHLGDIDLMLASPKSRAIPSDRRRKDLPRTITDVLNY